MKRHSDLILERTVVEVFPRSESTITDDELEAFLAGVATALEAIR